MGSTGGGGGLSGSEGSSDSALLLAVRGTDYYRQGDMNQSLVSLNKSLSLDPYLMRAWITKGDVLYAMGRFDEAVDSYSRALLLDPSDGSAAAKKGDALLNAGRYQDAITSYDRAIAADPGLPGVQANRSIAKQLANGTTRKNLSVTGPDEDKAQVENRDLIEAALPGPDTQDTIPVVSPPPPTAKAAVPAQLVIMAIIIAGVLTTCFRK